MTGPAIPIGEWSHVAATRRIVDGKAIVRIYINGVKAAEAADLALPYTTTTGTPSVVVGGRNTQGYGTFYGLIGSVKLNDFALSDAQVYAEAQRAKRTP